MKTKMLKVTAIAERTIEATAIIRTSGAEMALSAQRDAALGCPGLVLRRRRRDAPDGDGSTAALYGYAQSTRTAFCSRQPPMSANLGCDTPRRVTGACSCVICASEHGIRVDARMSRALRLASWHGAGQTSRSGDHATAAPSYCESASGRVRNHVVQVGRADQVGVLQALLQIRSRERIAVRHQR